MAKAAKKRNAKKKSGKTKVARARTTVKKIMKKSAGSKKKTSAAPSRKAKRADNRRKHRRYPTKNLWITEYSGDYQFIVPAGDISEGGIFLKGRFKTTVDASRINIPLEGEMAALELIAQPIYDRTSGEGYGTGYRFLNMSAAQSKALRGLLRNLD